MYLISSKNWSGNTKDLRCLLSLVIVPRARGALLLLTSRSRVSNSDWTIGSLNTWPRLNFWTFSLSMEDKLRAFGSRIMLGLIWNFFKSSISVISMGNLVPMPVVIGTGSPVKFSRRLDFPQDCAPAMTSCAKLVR